MKQIEMITWHDSISLGGWQHVGDMDNWAGRTITTIGFVMQDGDKDIVVAQSVGNASAGEVACNWLSIPKSCVLLRRIIGEFSA